MNKHVLLAAAADALQRAHAPYSSYQVGAALYCSDGTIITGCNVENASYGLTNCAERTAFFSAIAAGKHLFTAMAIVADGDNVPLPCGACRQVMTEFCGPDFNIYCARQTHLDQALSFTLNELLPHAFELNEGDQ